MVAASSPGWAAGCRRFIRERPHGASLLVFTGLLAAVFADPLSHPHALIANHAESDMVHMWAPYKAYLRQQFQRTGRVPLWCPVNHGGWSTVGHPEMGLFYPPFWLFLLSGSPWIFSLELVGHLAVGGGAMYALGIRHRVSPAGALVSALTFALAIPILARIYAGHLNVVCEVALFPVALLAFEALPARGYRSSPVMGAALAAVILPGHLQFPYYLILVLSAWALADFAAESAAGWARLVRGPRSTRPATLRTAVGHGLHRRFGPWLLACAVAAGLAAPQLLSTAEMARHFVRHGGLGLSDAVGASFWFPSEVPYVLASAEAAGPIVHRPGVSGVLHYVHWEGCLYLGLLPLGLALATLGDPGRRRGLRPYWVIAAAALLFAGGPAGGLFSLVYRLVPGAALVRLPTRAGTLFVPCAALLSGAGLDVMLARSRRGAVVRRRSLRLVGMTGLVLVTLTAVFLAARTSWGRSAGLPALLAAGRGPFHVPRHPLVARTLWHTSALPLLAAAAAWVVLPGGRPIKVPAAVILVLIDLGLTGRPLVRASAIDPGRSRAPFGAILRAEPRPFRLYAIGDRPEEPGGYAWDGLPTAWQAVAGGLELANGDLTLRLQEWDDALGARGIGPAGLARLGLLNVRFLLSTRPLPANPDLPLMATASAPGSKGGPATAVHPGATVPARLVYLYRNRHCLPRAWVVSAVRVIPDRSQLLRELGRIDPRQVALVEQPPAGPSPVPGAPRPDRAADSSEVQVEYPTPEQVIIHARTSGPGYLILGDPWYPGWQASDNGRPAAVLRADAALRCIPLAQAGTHIVALRYRPTWLTVGLVVMVLTLVLGGAATASRATGDSRWSNHGGNSSCIDWEGSAY